MKTTERTLLYILLAGVAGLYILYFTGRSSSEVHEEEISLDTLKSEVKGEKTGRIYYVNTDSVWDNYEYVKDVSEKLINKKTQFENQIQREVQNFEREVNEFREKGAMMSEVEVQIKQQALVRKEQELSKMGEDLETRYLNEEKEWNSKLRSKIVSAIDEQTADKSYDYILGYSLTGNIILANDSLDLTQEVIDALNSDYLQSQKAEK